MSSVPTFLAELIKPVIAVFAEQTKDRPLLAIAITAILFLLAGIYFPPPANQSQVKVSFEQTERYLVPEPSLVLQRIRVNYSNAPMTRSSVTVNMPYPAKLVGLGGNPIPNFAPDGNLSGNDKIFIFRSGETPSHQELRFLFKLDAPNTFDPAAILIDLVGETQDGVPFSKSERGTLFIR